MGADLRAMAQELLTLAAIRHTINAEYARRQAALRREYENSGIKAQHLEDLENIGIGDIVLTAAPVSVEIGDRDAMLEWLETEHPEEVVTEPTIRPRYLRVLIDAARKAGVGVDPTTGARIDWLTVTVGDPTLRATATPEAKARVRELITRAGLHLELEA